LNESFSAFRNKIPLRVGTAYRYYSFLFNHKVYDHRKTADFHEAEYNTRLVSSVLKKKVKTELVKPYVNIESVEYINSILIQKGINNNNFIIIHPGSGGSAYNWNTENFGKAGKTISDETGLGVVITGTQQESNICEKAFRNCTNSVNLCGKLNLRQMIALISNSKLLIANSTGVLHIAAALDIPVIGLYPNTPHLSAKRWGPYSKKSVIVSPPNIDDKKKRDNMDLINVDEVIKSAKELLNRC
jgi:ADP-heptose:LPS heptosyltransferase